MASKSQTLTETSGGVSLLSGRTDFGSRFGAQLETDVTTNGDPIYITVYEDPDQDGNVENFQQKKIPDGTSTQRLGLLRGTSGTDYWLEISLQEEGDVTDTASVNSTTVNTFHQTISEVVGVIDSFNSTGGTQEFVQTVSEIVGGVDTLSTLKRGLFTRKISSTVGTVESISFVKTIVKAFSEASGTVDTLTKAQPVAVQTLASATTSALSASRSNAVSANVASAVSDALAAVSSAVGSTQGTDKGYTDFNIEK